MAGWGVLDAQTWIQKVGGPGLGNPLTVNPLNSDVIYGAAGSNRVYISRDRGYTWFNFGSLITGGGVIKSLSVNTPDTSEILAGMESTVGLPDRIMKSTDAGTTWTETWAGTFSYFGQPVEFSPLHPDTVYTMGLDTLYRSVDFGSTWDTVATGRGFNAWCDAAIRPDSAAVMYIGDNLSGIWKTDDHGDSWRKVYSTIGEIPSIAIDPFDPRVGYAGKFGGGGGLVKSTDWGETWHTLLVPSGNRDAWWVVCSPVHPGYLYYGTYTGDSSKLGIYMSRDSGANWTRLIEGLPQSAIFNYGLLTLDSLTLLALQGSGIFKYQYPTEIEVLSPAGGEYWLADSQYTINWSATGLYYVNIDYSPDGGNSWLPIADSIPVSQTSYEWTTPSLLSESSLVRVSDALFTSTEGVSDSFFTITNAYLTINSPNGGEVWDAGSLQVIDWSSVSLDSLRLEYSADSGSSWNLVTVIPAAAGSFGWQVPKSPTEAALVRMQGVDDTNVVDVSDAVFTIRYLNTFTGDIVVTDAGLESDTVTFGMAAGATDGIDTSLGEAELPSPPGPGNFDLRWMLPGVEGVRTDLRDTLTGPDDSHLYALAFQPGAGGYPLSVSWVPDSLQAGVFIMRDLPGAAATLNLNMRRDSAVVIADSSVHGVEILVCEGEEVTISGNGGWSLVSLPLETGDHRVGSIFPFFTGGAFEYAGGYVKRDTLVPGVGYWVKAQQSILQGCPLLTETTAVRPGWNIIGAPSRAVAVTDLITSTDSLIVSPFYGYGSGGYFFTDSLHPGEGYWVKCKTSGTIVMDAGSEVPPPTAHRVPGRGRLNRLTVGLRGSDGRGTGEGTQSTLFFAPDPVPGWLESPPPPPGALPIALFGNGEIGVLHPDYPKYPIEYEMTLNTPVMEIFFSWSIEIGENFNYILNEYIGTEKVSTTYLAGAGSALITRTRDSKFSLQVHPLDSGSTGIPTEYVMGRFYPNPFNPSTRATFLLPTGSVVSYEICNLLGEIVKSSDETSYPAGEHVITWDGRRDDGSTVGSGVYFLSFRARSSATDRPVTSGDFSAVRKLLFVR